MRRRFDVGLAPTRRATVRRLGGGRLIRFRGSLDPTGPTVLLVPSLLHRWYVLDLHRGSSLVEALVEGGLDVYLFDWGLGADEDRFVGWDELITRLCRVIRWTRRHASVPRIGLLGHSMGATLATIAAALAPDEIDSLVNLTGPVDFSCIGPAARLVDPRWFDVDAIAAAGNVSALQLRAGFVTLNPTVWLVKARELAERALEPGALRAVGAREAWVNDGVAFPAAAYVRYIRDLYRNNELVRGEHHIDGRRVDLSAITCPTLAVAAARDEICPPAAALALLDAVASPLTTPLVLDGGHVDSVIGHRARHALYPALIDHFRSKQ